MNVGSRILRGMSDSRRRSSSPSGPTWSPSQSTVRMIVTAIVILALLVFVYLTSTFWVQWWWFESVGYQTALTTRYVSSALAFIAAGLLGGFTSTLYPVCVAHAHDRMPADRVVAVSGRLILVSGNSHRFKDLAWPPKPAC